MMALIDVRRITLKVSSNIPWYGPWTKSKETELSIKHACIYFLATLKIETWNITTYINNKKEK